MDDLQPTFDFDSATAPETKSDPSSETDATEDSTPVRRSLKPAERYRQLLLRNKAESRTIDSLGTGSTQDATSTENLINDLRLQSLDQSLTPRFISLLRDEDFEFGYASESESVLREQLRINRLATRNWLNALFSRYYHDDTIVIGILRLLGRFEEREISPQGPTMALAALSHKNNEIKDLGVRAFESWASPSSLNVLKHTSTGTEWLDQYIQKVIDDIEEQLCLS